MTTAAVDDTDNPSTNKPVPRRRSLLGRAFAGLLWLGIGGAAFLLAMAWLYPSNLRETSRPLMLLNCFAFAGSVLQVHLALAAAAALLPALLLRRWRLSTVALLVLIIGAGPTMLTWLPKDPPPIAGPTLRVHSMNLLKVNEDAEAILNEVNRVNADVLLLQEFHLQHAQALDELLDARYPHSISYADPSVRGMAIYSKRPLHEATPDGVDHVVGDWGVIMQRVAIEHEGRPLAIYNIHPTSPGNPRLLSWNQYQAVDVINAAKAESLPFVLAGDFNAATGTTNLERLEALGLVESQSLAGRGPGWTWPRMRGDRPLHKILRALPGIRIDHCYLSPALTATSAEVGRYHGSDHLGVIVDIGWRQSSQIMDAE